MSKKCVLYIPKNAPARFRAIAKRLLCKRDDGYGSEDADIREFGNVIEYSIRIDSDDECESCFSDTFLDNLENAGVPFDYLEYVYPLMHADYENRRYFRPADECKTSGNCHYGEHMVFPTAVAKYLASDDKDGLMAYMKEALAGQLPDTTIAEAAEKYVCDEPASMTYEELDAEIRKLGLSIKEVDDKLYVVYHGDEEDGAAERADELLDEYNKTSIRTVYLKDDGADSHEDVDAVLLPKKSVSDEAADMDAADDEEEAMDEDDMKRELYRLYQLDWCISHGVSLDGIFDQIRRISSDAEDFGDDPSADSAIKQMEDSEGLCDTGCIYACYGEFCDTELRNHEYMLDLIELLHDGRQRVKDAYEKFAEENRDGIWF